jgi:hypothetical protein
MRLMTLMTVAALAWAVPAFAEDWDFVLVNDSGKEIRAIEMSPAGAGAWQPNRIDPGVPSPVRRGGRAMVNFDRDSNICRYDVKATFVDGTHEVWANINVCDNGFVTVRYRNGAPVFAAD